MPAPAEQSGAVGVQGTSHSLPPFDMVADVNMPGYSGVQLAERACAFRPEPLVLLLSGHESDGCGFPLSQKPFRSAAPDYDILSPHDGQPISIAKNRVMRCSRSRSSAESSPSALSTSLINRAPLPDVGLGRQHRWNGRESAFSVEQEHVELLAHDSGLALCWFAQVNLLARPSRASREYRPSARLLR